MGEFPAAITAIAIVFVFGLVLTLGFDLGKVNLRSSYHKCIELGAPQQNCVDNFLGMK